MNTLKAVILKIEKGTFNLDGYGVFIKNLWLYKTMCDLLSQDIENALVHIGCTLSIKNAAVHLLCFILGS